MTKTSEKIIEVAEYLFYTHGINNIGVDKINEIVGCSKTTMYNNFGSKDKLILEVLKYRDLNFRASLLEYIGKETKTLEVIRKIFEWHNNWFKEDNFNGCMFIRTLTELDVPDEDIKCIIQEHKDWVWNLLFEKTQDHNYSTLLMLLLEGLISMNLVYGDSKDKCDSYLETALSSIEENRTK